ncbi:uncharacterized protein AKAME5_001677900 [Lates japonicus]|uniref:Uncharacterized protein n=1 Tax=Lates japonicus TaxID=270547 RepID=A0AAD3N3W0_LATJO|nr:uncharacterized protein AKAME5_001677900 [Lates japonicus]
MKRLRTRKERSQMRGGERETSKTKSYHHHCRRQNSKDTAHFHSCCHSSCHCPSRRDVPFPNVVPAAQEPSIITDSRLIGHHGLFNHEVKSIHIERLLSEQGKQEKSGQKAQEKNHAISHPSLTPHIPSPLPSNDLLGADTDEVVPFEKKAESATDTHDDCQEKEKKISHGSDITPGQRPQQQPDLSSGSYKSLDVVIIKSMKANSVMPEKYRESQLAPTISRDNVKMLNKNIKTRMASTLKPIAKNQEPPAHQTQAHGLSPSPLQFFSSPTADNFGIQHRRQDPGSVSKCVSTVAARLCDRLHFPLMRRRNLVAESREVLLKALRERHGPRLQENLFREQQHLSSDTDLTKAVQDHIPEPSMRDEDELLPTEKASASQFWEDSFNRPKSKELFTFDSFDNSFMNHTRAARERSHGPEHNDSNIQPFFPYQTQLPDRHSAEPMHFAQEKDPSETDRYSFTPSFPTQSHNPNQSNRFQTFNQFSHPSSCPPLRSYHTDMTFYPPSHMLERSPAPPLSSLPSPELWSFPPMRLY